MKVGSKKVAKKKYFCSGGPWNGEHLYLASVGTAWLNIGGSVGRYARSEISQMIVWELKK